MISLRYAIENDSVAIIEYCNTAAGESDNLSFGANQFPLSEAQEREYIKNLGANNYMLLAIDEQRIIGLANLRTDPKERLKHNGSVGLSVLKDYQGQGVGSMLFERLIELATENQVIESLQLEVRSDNQVAINLYRKYNFKKVGVLPNNMKIQNQYYDVDIMHLQLV